MNNEFQLYTLSVSVVGDPETFVCSHKLGENFQVIGENLVFNEINSFSMYALSSLLPLLPVKQRQTHKNDWISTDNIIACPDPHCGAKFEIKRLDLTTFRHNEVTKVPLSSTK